MQIIHLADGLQERRCIGAERYGLFFTGGGQADFMAATVFFIGIFFDEFTFEQHGDGIADRRFGNAECQSERGNRLRAGLEAVQDARMQRRKALLLPGFLQRGAGDGMKALERR